MVTSVMPGTHEQNKMKKKKPETPSSLTFCFCFSE